MNVGEMSTKIKQYEWIGKAISLFHINFVLIHELESPDRVYFNVPDADA